MSQTKVPCVDVSTFIDSNDAAVVEQIKKAAEEVGFFSITGVESIVSADLMSRMWGVSKTYFDQPVEEKTKCYVKRTNGETFPWGYFPTKSEALAAARGTKTPPDLREAFSIGPLTNDTNNPCDDIANITGEWHKFPNPWASKPAELRPTMEEYYTALLKLSTKLQEIFALALGLDKDYFVPTSKDPICSLRLINYPPQDVPPGELQLRAGAHTDWGDFTILATDSVGGLQICCPNTNEWISVTAPPGAFVINIGDLMARWTNDKWRSTLHRVINSDGDTNSVDKTERKSIAFFHNPDMEAEIDIICGVGEKRKYDKTVTAGEHLKMMFERSKKAGTDDK